MNSIFLHLIVMLLVVEPSTVVVLNADGGHIARVGLVCVNSVGVCHNCDVGHMTFIWNFNILKLV